MKAYSLDLRQKIVETYEGGGISQRQLAERFCVSVFFVKKLFRQQRNKGTLAPLPRSGWQKSLVTDQMRELIVQMHREKNDLTLSEVAAQIEDECGVRLSTPTVCRVIKRLDLRRKKS